MTGRFPRGRYELEWRDRDRRVANVLYVTDRRPRALTEGFFRLWIPRWRAAGLRVTIDVDAEIRP